MKHLNYTTVKSGKDTVAKAATVLSSYYNATHDCVIAKVRKANSNEVISLQLKGGKNVQPYLSAGKMISYTTTGSVVNTYNDGRKYTTDYTTHITLG